MSELRVGIIGFGMIGKVHAFGYRTLPFYTHGLLIRPRVTHVATAHAETAAAAAELLGCRGVTDWRQITENPEIDAVHICTPNREHLAPLLSAIGQNKHIYCDKPLTSSLDEALRVEEALGRTGAAGEPLYTKVGMMTFHLRFIPALILAKRLIGEGRLGRIFEYRAAYQHSSNAAPDVPYKWKFDAGGGAILDLGSHLADLTDWLIGLPDEVCAESVIAYPDRFDPKTGKERAVLAEDAFTVQTRTADPKSGHVTRGLISGTKLATGSEDEMFLEIFLPPARAIQSRTPGSLPPNRPRGGSARTRRVSRSSPPPLKRESNPRRACVRESGFRDSWTRYAVRRSAARGSGRTSRALPSSGQSGGALPEG